MTNNLAHDRFALRQLKSGYLVLCDKDTGETIPGQVDVTCLNSFDGGAVVKVSLCLHGVKLWQGEDGGE